MSAAFLKHEVEARQGLVALAKEMRDAPMPAGSSARAALDRIFDDPTVLECLDALGWRHEDDIARDDLDADQAAEAYEQEDGEEDELLQAVDPLRSAAQEVLDVGPGCDGKCPPNCKHELAHRELANALKEG